ncbi:MAG: hypothetical protein KatS3mg068_0215 [Candidatus Sericytochromatia bacterium]|nr:MAG: hypothetical protein KatS3mg068_0215 [Candidatus Sericytochromatia bacterium]
MIKNKKITSSILLSLSILITSCSPPIDNKDIINLVSQNTISIPDSNRGAISSDINFNLGTGIVAPETTVRIIREEDIPERDKDGKIVKDSSGKDKFLERKGQVIATTKVVGGRFLVSNLRPGKVTVEISNKQETQQIQTTVQAGIINQLPTISFNSVTSGGKRTTINITGKVVAQNGTPIANAKVADVTGGKENNFVNTNAEGEFSLPVASFDTARNLEVSFNNLITSLSVTSDNIENLNITLIPNTRTLKGVIVDSVLKDKKPIKDVTVKLINSNNLNVSTVTDEKGNFTLRGIPLSPISLEIGNKEGFITKTINVESSTRTEEKDLGKIELQGIGNLFVNLVADNYLDINQYPGQGPFPDPPPFGAYTVVMNGTTTTYYYNNTVVFEKPLTGTIQIEGTNIITQFTYPATATVEPAPQNIIGNVSTPVVIYKRNPAISVPIKNIPAGIYNISVALEHHEVQKSIKVVIPGNDTIATELIKLNLVAQVQAPGDIRGKVIIKDVDGNDVSTSGLTIKVFTIEPATVNELGKPGFITSTLNNPNTKVATTNSDGTYLLKDATSGTRIVVAVVVDSSNNPDPGYLAAPYVLLNVIPSIVNNAADMTIIKRP